MTFKKYGNGRLGNPAKQKNLRGVFYCKKNKEEGNYVRKTI
jgi:hypothetical protein